MSGLVRSLTALACAAVLELFAVSADAGGGRGEPKRAMREIEQSAALVRIELRAARAAGDQFGARCVSDKLSEVHAQLRLASQHSLRSDTTKARERQQRFVTDRARERAREIARAARRCREPATGRAALRRVPKSG